MRTITEKKSGPVHDWRTTDDDEMGLGKTIQAIAACALLHCLGKARRALVVTPASLKGAWEEQIGRFTALPCRCVYGGRHRRLAFYGASAARWCAARSATRKRGHTRRWSWSSSGMHPCTSSGSPTFTPSCSDLARPTRSRRSRSKSSPALDDALKAPLGYSLGDAWTRTREALIGPDAGWRGIAQTLQQQFA